VPALHVAERDGKDESKNLGVILFPNGVDEEGVSMGLDGASDVIGSMV